MLSKIKIEIAKHSKLPSGKSILFMTFLKQLSLCAPFINTKTEMKPKTSFFCVSVYFPIYAIT